MIIEIGADWDTEKCVVAFERDGRVHRAEVKQHPDALARFVSEMGEGQLVVGIESGDGLWVRLWENAGAQVRVFDAKMVRRFSESLSSSGARDDKRSAEALLGMLKSTAHQDHASGELRGRDRAIHQLLRLFDVSSNDVVQQTNRLRSQLSQVHPALARAVNRSWHAAWFLTALQQAPTPSAWLELPETQREACMSGSNKERRAQMAQAFGEDWKAIDPDEEQSVRLHIELLVASVKSALSRKKRAKAALEAAARECDISDAIKNLEGFGPFLTAATAVGLSRGQDAGRDGLGMALGSSPVTVRSGVMGDRRPNVKMRRAAPPLMRKASHILGFQLVGNYRFAKAQYAFYRARGISANGAYRRLARSFSRVLVALNRDGVPFDEDLYIERLKRKGVQWALELT